MCLSTAAHSLDQSLFLVTNAFMALKCASKHPFHQPLPLRMQFLSCGSHSSSPSFHPGPPSHQPTPFGLTALSTLPNLEYSHLCTFSSFNSPLALVPSGLSLLCPWPGLNTAKHHSHHFASQTSSPLCPSTEVLMRTWK